jgi:hypothetical protein
VKEPRIGRQSEVKLTVRHERNLIVFAFDHQTRDLERLALVLLQKVKQILHGASGVDDVFDDQHILATQILQIFDADDLQFGSGRVVFVAFDANEFDRDLVSRVVVAAIEREELIELFDFGQQIVKVLVAAFQHTKRHERLVFEICDQSE